MSTTDLAPEPVAVSGAHATRPRGRTLTSAATWVTASDSKVVGRLFMAGAGVALVACAAVGALLGIERIDGDGTIIDEGALPQLFWAFRIGLPFGVVVPLLLGLALAVVPLQVGARSLAFPRL